MTEQQVLSNAYTIVLNSYRIMELAKRKDKDIFDILYNWVDAISLNDTSMIKEIAMLFSLLKILLSAMLVIMLLRLLVKRYLIYLKKN